MIFKFINTKRLELAALTRESFASKYGISLSLRWVLINFILFFFIISLSESSTHSVFCGVSIEHRTTVTPNGSPHEQAPPISPVLNNVTLLLGPDAGPSSIRRALFDSDSHEQGSLLFVTQGGTFYQVRLPGPSSEFLDSFILNLNLPIQSLARMHAMTYRDHFTAFALDLEAYYHLTVHQDAESTGTSGINHYFDVFNNAISTLALSKNGLILATGTTQGQVRFHSTSTSIWPLSLALTPSHGSLHSSQLDRVASLVFSSDLAPKTHVLIGHASGTIHYALVPTHYDRNTPPFISPQWTRHHMKPPGSNAPLFFVGMAHETNFSNDPLMTSVDTDGNITVMKLRETSFVRSFSTATTTHLAALSPDGLFLALAQGKRGVQIWKLPANSKENFQQQSSFDLRELLSESDVHLQPHPDANIISMAYSQNGRSLAVVTSDGKLYQIALWAHPSQQP